MAQEITPILSGAVIAHQEPVLEISGYADIFVQLSDGIPEKQQWSRMLRKIDDWIDDHLLPNASATSGNTPLTFAGLTGPLHERVNLLRGRAGRHLAPIPPTPTSTRRKRGLIDGIGKLSSWLFGTATNDDIKKLTAFSRKVAGAVEGVATSQNQIIGKVNMLGRNQRGLSRSLNDLIQKHNRQEAALAALTGTVTGVHTLALVNQRMIRLMNTLSTFSELMHNRENFNQKARVTRLACESNTVNEDLVPPAILQEVLDSPLNHAQVSVLKYYSYLQVQKIVTIDDTDYCIMRAPVFETIRNIEYTIATFPICNGTCLQLTAPPPFLIIPVTEEITFPEVCVGYDPKACRPSVRYSKASMPCYTGLISGDVEAQKECVMTLHPRQIMSQPVPTTELNKYVLTTRDTSYHYRCPSIRPTSGKLKAGSYLINIAPGCMMDASEWILKGLTVAKYDYNATLYEPRDIDLSWLNLATATLDLNYKPETMNPLVVENFEELAQLPASQLVADLDNLKIEAGHLPWWFWLTMTLGIIIGLLIFLYVCQKRHPCSSLPRFSLVRTNPASAKTQTPIYHVNATGDGFVELNSESLATSTNALAPEAPEDTTEP